MCQLTTGTAVALLVTGHGVVFEGTPERFASADVAARCFCAACGTPIFHALANTEAKLMIGSLDVRDTATPGLRCGVENHKPWLHFAHGLPEYGPRPGSPSGLGPATIESRQDPAGARAGKETP
ncbi:GFA family protein [Rhodobacteraceae bacterium DSL-40]|uniref:GFA family protein n=1 Tax=Amaricoccus sp. B4 TaxID=3368557 RepID=UPI000DAD3E4D